MRRRSSVSGPTYRVPFRRRHERKTNYRKRLKLLLSRKPRVVIRMSNKYIRMQLVSSDMSSDITSVDVISSELKRYGYEGGKSNIPAAYLTGLMFGKKAKEAGFDAGVLDIGLRTPVRGSRVYAALKGVIDSGLVIPHESIVFPPEVRIRGEHIASVKNDDTILDTFDIVKGNILKDKVVEEKEVTALT